MKHSEVLCFGLFNSLHAGHLRFLSFAKSLGQKVIIGLFFEEEKDYLTYSHILTFDQRKKMLLDLDLADEVIPTDRRHINTVLDRADPDVVVIGKPVSDVEVNFFNEISEHISNKRSKIIIYSGNPQVSGLKAVEPRTSLSSLCATMDKHGIQPNDLYAVLDEAKNKRVAVIGDVIVDRYVSSEALGISAEAPVMVVKELQDTRYLGGAAIIASHISGLGAQCSLFTITGDDENSRFLRDYVSRYNISMFYEVDTLRPTTEKIRYVVDGQKVFRVSRLSDSQIQPNHEDSLMRKLEETIEQFDCIIISDFQYGVVSETFLENVTRLAKRHSIKLVGDVQCSTQTGSIAKMKDFDLLTPTEKEARIALSDQTSTLETLCHGLRKQTKVKDIVITLGAEGFILHSHQISGTIVREQIPALSSHAVDVAGAGDALLSSMSLAMCCTSNIVTSSILGALSSKIAVETIGNQPISSNQLKLEILELSKISEFK